MSEHQVLCTDAEIIEKFLLLEERDGMTRTRLGYFAVGQPNIIQAIEEGRRIQDNTRMKLSASLDMLIKNGTKTPFSEPPKNQKLFDDMEILDRFYRLNAVIGLGKAQFGYIAVGRPNVITAIERGRSIHDNTRKRISWALDQIEKQHTEPIPEQVGSELEE